MNNSDWQVERQETHQKEAMQLTITGAAGVDTFQHIKSYAGNNLLIYIAVEKIL